MSEIEDCYQLFAGIEVERFEVLFELGNWQPQHLTYRPEVGAWSAVEVLDHIVKSESSMVKRVCEGLAEPHPLVAEDRSRVASLERALRTDRKFPVPLVRGELILTLKQSSPKSPSSGRSRALNSGVR